MIVGFTDRAGVHGSHQSNVIRKSSKHVGRDIDAISGCMRESTSCNGRVCLATPPDPSTRQVMGTGHPREGSLPHDLLAKTLHETTDEKLEEVEVRSRQEVEWSSIDAIINWRGGTRDIGNQVIVEFPKTERRHSTGDNGNQVIVEFPQAERRKSTPTGNAEDHGDDRETFSTEMLFQSTKGLTSLDRKPRTDRENPIKEMLSRSLTSVSRSISSLDLISCTDGVEFPQAERRKSAPTGNAEEHGEVRENPITEMFFERTKSVTSFDRKPRVDRGNPIKEMLSRSLISVDRKPRRDWGNPIKDMLSRSLSSLDFSSRTEDTSGFSEHPKHQQTNQDHQGKHTHQLENALNLSEETIDWGGENNYWKYELNIYPDQKDGTRTRQ